jgi:hypothetical protein
VTSGAIKALVALCIACGLCGCGRDHTLACEGTERYSTASSAPPVQIPDDLSPPDETNSLRLPPTGAATAAVTRPCLETPPGFYADGAPGGTRLGNPPARPAPPAPAPAVADPPADPDRQIGN